MRSVLSHVGLENCRSIRCAHTARIDAGVATRLPLPDIPRSHPHLALKQYQFLDDFSSSHSLQFIGPTVFTLAGTATRQRSYPPPSHCPDKNPECRSILT